MVRNLLFTQLGLLIILYFAQAEALRFYAAHPNELVFAPSHFLGGIWVACAAATVYAHRGWSPSIVVWSGVALLFGVFWEVFEASTHLVNIYSTIYVPDTFSDLTIDLLGGFVGALFIKKFLV
ncbi:MAG: hypothetical protein WC050_02340 [Candidatus Paceibacterota bacterium]